MFTKIRKLAAVLAATVVSFGAAGAFPMNAKAQNPLVQTNFSPDPAPVVFGDELWVFTGCDRQGNNDNYYMVVRVGDSLADIAEETGISIKKLARVQQGTEKARHHDEHLFS